MTAQTQKQLPLEALSDVVKAWESLQGQSYHSVKAVEDWLAGPMLKAINNAREVLKTTNAPVTAQRPTVNSVMYLIQQYAGKKGAQKEENAAQCLAEIQALVEDLAAPVAAQPTFEKGSWQHAVDDQLVGFGRTSQEFGSPHDAVRWLIEQEVQAAQPTREQAQRERMEARQWNAKAFNFPEYFAALQRAMQARNATPADVSRATGVSATTLTRMKEGRRPDAASLAALSAWAGLNPAAYVKLSPATEDFDLPAQSDEVAAQPQRASEVIKHAVGMVVQVATEAHHPTLSAQPQQATSLSDAEILDLAIPFGAFEYGDSQGHKRLAFTRAAITAFCQKNGIKEQG